MTLPGRPPAPTFPHGARWPRRELPRSTSAFGCRAAQSDDGQRPASSGTADISTSRTRSLFVRNTSNTRTLWPSSGDAQPRELVQWWVEHDHSVNAPLVDDRLFCHRVLVELGLVEVVDLAGVARSRHDVLTESSTCPVRPACMAVTSPCSTSRPGTRCTPDSLPAHAKRRVSRPVSGRDVRASTSSLAPPVTASLPRSPC